MAVRADRRYPFRVVDVSLMQSAAKKTPGVQLILDTDDGTIDYTIWLTEKNKERAERDFETLGVERAKLGTANFYNYEMSGLIVGREGICGTVEEYYKEQPRVKVAWIGKLGAETPEDLAASAASVFGAESLDAGPGREAPSAAELNTLDQSDSVPF